MVEVKRNRPDRPVGIELVRQLYASLTLKRASQAMLVTTSTSTRGARELENAHKLQLSLHDYAVVVEWVRQC